MKKNGQIRIVIDFRKLNAKTIKQYFPIPKIPEIIAQFKDTKYFSQFDLKLGYCQLAISEDSIPLASFIIGDKQYECCRLFFGLTNGPFAFQRIMTRIFSSYPSILVFTDGIALKSKTLEKHLELLEIFFRVARENNLSVNFEKSHIC